MNKIAIIDLGTNTFNLLIVEVAANKSYTTLYEGKISVKLGEGGINKGYIAEVPFQRGIDAIKTHKHTIEKFSADNIFAMATSAIRSASNGQAFVDEVKKTCGIEIKVISGDEEAAFICEGVREAVTMDNEKSIIMDIGGGSTEFIIANKLEVFWKQSFKLGAARLLEKINPSDPIKNEEIKQLTDYLESELQPLFKAAEQFPVSEIIGSSGSFDSLSEMIALKYYNIEVVKNKTEYDYHLDDFYKLYEIILKSTKEERMKMDGLISMRVDMIVISCILLHFVMQKLEIKKMRSSTYSLKEGILHRILHTDFN